MAAWRRIWTVVATASLIGAASGCGPGESSRQPAETYRLVHAIGNTENVSDRNLSKADCEARKAELKAVATAIGTYNEATGQGSITCLPESDFR